MCFLEAGNVYVVLVHLFDDLFSLCYLSHALDVECGYSDHFTVDPFVYENVLVHFVGDMSPVKDLFEVQFVTLVCVGRFDMVNFIFAAFKSPVSSRVRLL